MPNVVATVADLARGAGGAPRRRASRMVPTMGALHEGHVSLMRAARAASERVLVSIFVNPAQFAPHEDFASYPRDLDADLAKISDADLVFAPPASGNVPARLCHQHHGRRP